MASRASSEDPLAGTVAVTDAGGGPVASARDGDGTIRFAVAAAAAYRLTVLLPVRP